MKENKELERQDIRVDSDMDVDCDIGCEITVYFETWFDVNKKFRTSVLKEDNTWLNMYGKYNPFEDTLKIECEICRENESEYFDYIPSLKESEMLKQAITEKIEEIYNKTPKEFCAAFYDGGQEIGGLI